jgi:hypothetical protein
MTEAGGATGPGRERDLAEQENPPSFETALQQLGLKLESGRGPVDVLVIDLGGDAEARLTQPFIRRRFANRSKLLRC